MKSIENLMLGMNHAWEPERSRGCKLSAAVLCFAVAFLIWSTERSGARRDTHRDPRTSAPVLPNMDYMMGHVGTPLRASGYSLLPTRRDREDRRPTNDLA